jgi:VIT1/CCC1 family predicted Fe2+/Mn2+ transporter/rubrerythrin
VSDAASGIRVRLLAAWRDEVEASIFYELIARRESDPYRAEILGRLAAAEGTHRDRLERRMAELGIAVPDRGSVKLSRWHRLQARIAPVDSLLARQESFELQVADAIEQRPTGDLETDRMFEQMRVEEQTHTRAIGQLRAGTVSALEPPEITPAGPAVRLKRITGRERGHRGATGWIPGAIYGANDGLAAVFGIVAGVSGATGGSSTVLTAGLFGAIASALSMATGAFLAERSTTEVAAANLARERVEVLSHPAEEKEELALHYQLKGLTEAEAKAVVERIAEDPEQLFRAIAVEEFGSADANSGDPVQASLAAGISTAFGAIIPVIPFFFITGYAGIAIAAGVSLLAHFAVGAAKSVFTLRSAWSAGLEMTLAGILVGGATYLLGLAIG